MYIKKLIALIIIFNIVIASMSFSSAKPADSNNSNNPEDFIKSFLSTKMYTLVTKKVDDIDKYYSEEFPDAQKYKLFAKQNLLTDYIISYSSNDYDIVKVKPRIKILSCLKEDKTATVDAVLLSRIYWNASNALGKPIIGMVSEKHTFKLNMENNQWKIWEDKYMTSRGHSDQSVGEDATRYSDTIEQLKKDAEKSLDRAKRSQPTRLTMASTVSKPVSKTSNRVSPGSAYNRAAAYNWAQTHWNNYSTVFINLGDNKWKGGDCTNFVSQCLKAGGAGNDKTGNYQWYYDSKGTGSTTDDSYSWTWSTSKGLNSILSGNCKVPESGPKGIEKSIIGDSEYSSSIGEFVEPGDIIQYQWKPEKNITHSALIVGMLYNSSKKRYEPVIAEHTYDSWSTPWTNNAYKTFFIHISDIN